MWTWIKAKWAAFIAWGGPKLTEEEQLARDEEEALLARWRARQAKEKQDSTRFGETTIIPPSPATMGAMGLVPKIEPTPQPPSRPADAPGNGTDMGAHNLGSAPTPPPPTGTAAQ